MSDAWTIKELQWRTISESSCWLHYRAETPFGDFDVTSYVGDVAILSKPRLGDSSVRASYETPEAAKAAAETWYCDRLQSALAPATDHSVIEEVRAKFSAVKETAYKLPNKCECSGSVACVCCNLLADISELEEALAKLDALTNQGAAK